MERGLTRVVSKLLEKKGVEWWLPGLGVGGKGKMLVRGHKLSVIR